MDENEASGISICVKIMDSISISNIDNGTVLTLDDLLTFSEQPDDEKVTTIRDLVPDLSFSWAFVSTSISDINGMIDRAVTEDPEYIAPKFDHFFEIACDENTDASALVEALNAWDNVVEYAYIVETASDPTINAPNNPLYSAMMQGYLGAAPDGIDAPSAWAKGADGSGISFIDIEQGWFLGHDDLPTTINLLQGSNRKTSFAHGAAVLGEIVASDNQAGIVGIAPNASAEILSYNDDLNSGLSIQRVADRIINAANSLPFGNVILLEIQIAGKVNGIAAHLPVETDPLVFEAIKLAVKVGVIVVEAGGNGSADIDAFIMDKGPRKGQHTLSRDVTNEFADSGAIVVGAATSASPHGRWPHSNFGSRIDCYSWGENIVTTGWDSTKPTTSNLYWGLDLTDANGNVSSFGGTSGASPVIVGCCLLVQNLRSLLTPISGSGKLGPYSMRRCLSNPINGTSSAQATDKIGVMPDLAKVIMNEFNP